MKISVIYIYCPSAGPAYEQYATRFLMDYERFPAGLEHESVVVLNGIKASSEVACQFCLLPNLRFVEHDNSGFDIGGFQAACRTCNGDLAVFFGASTYLKGEGWLLRMANSFLKHGDALYGTMGNRGMAEYGVSPHIRTTAFWTTPRVFNSYPERVTSGQGRYPFEHGPNCFTSWVLKNRMMAWVVNWKRELVQSQWDSDPNGFHRGNQSALIAGDRLSEPPFYKCP